MCKCHKIDFIAPKVQFTYKDKLRQGGVLGGCISLVFILAIAAYGLLQLITMMTGPDYTSNTVTQYQAVNPYGPSVQKNGSFPAFTISFYYFGDKNITAYYSEFFQEYYAV